LHEDVRRLEVLVDDASAVELGDRSGDVHGEAEEAPERHRAFEEALERLSPEVLEDERRHPAVGLEPERPRDGRDVERGSGLVLVPQPVEVLLAAAVRIQHLEDDRAGVAAAEGPVQRGPAVLVERLGGREFLDGLRAHLLSPTGRSTGGHRDGIRSRIRRTPERQRTLYPQ
jgi:hypothetical protein